MKNLPLLRVGFHETVSTSKQRRQVSENQLADQIFSYQNVSQSSRSVLILTVSFAHLRPAGVTLVLSCGGGREGPGSKPLIFKNKKSKDSADLSCKEYK